MKLLLVCGWCPPFISIALFCATMVGCGGHTPRHVVTGKVTYQGQALEYGSIIFEPEASVGMVAPTTVARIENGVFKTEARDSPTTGTYKVRVLGFDKSKEKVVEGITDTPNLFPEHTLRVEIPPPEGRLDIEVPDRASPGGSR